MHHRISGKKLGRTLKQRQALVRQQVRSIFSHGHLSTTETKAKFIQPVIENISYELTNSAGIVTNRLLFRYLQDRHLVKRIVSTFSPVFANQKSNFTKITRIKHRQGDNALIVKLEFVKPYRLEPVKVESKKPVKDTPKTPPKPVKKVKAKTS
jgi:large subunit ribosomal protein L17